jgi:hypothetical protein
MKLSKCCNALSIGETDLCSECKEHADFYDYDKYKKDVKRIRRYMKRDTLKMLSVSYKKGSGQYKVVKKMLSRIKFFELEGLWCMVNTLCDKELDE